MEEEIIEFIGEAEREASELKERASARASVVRATAETEAERIVREGELANKEYRERTLRAAAEQAHARYEEEVSLRREETEAYCGETLSGADVLIADIVGRILK